jgi:hypothetical protein
MMQQPKNIKELRDGLSEIFADLCNSTIKPGVAKEANNTAGKIIGSLKVELENAALRKTEPNIGYLAYSSSK